MKRLHRVLHVEDVPSIQVVTRIALEKLGGYEVLSCASGQAALAEVQAFAPDLILRPGAAGPDECPDRPAQDTGGAVDRPV